MQSLSIKEKTDSKDQVGAKTSVKAMCSIREQAIEKYTALTRHKRELLRRNQKIQTKIAQNLRKNKIELTSSTGQALGEEEEKSEYTRLLQELADLMENSERENTEFEQEMADIQVNCQPKSKSQSPNWTGADTMFTRVTHYHPPPVITFKNEVPL